MLGFVQTAVFQLVSKQDCTPALQEGTLRFLWHLGPADISPVGFPIQTFWGLISLAQILGAGVPDTVQQPLAPQGEVPVW